MASRGLNSTTPSDNRSFVVILKPLHEWQDYVQVALLLCIVAVGVPVNLIALMRTVITCRRCRSLRTSHAIILKVHLTVVDILVLLFYAASRAVWVITMKFMAGDFSCKLLKFFQTFVLCCNTNLLAVVAIDRLIAVRNVKRLPGRNSWRRFQKMINVAYALAFVLSIPQMFVWETIAPWPADPDWAQCVTVWTSERFRNFLQTLPSSPNATLDARANASTRVSNVNSTLPSATESDYNPNFSFYTVEKLYSAMNMILCFNVPFVIVIVSYALVCSKFRRSIEETQQDLILENRRKTSLVVTSIKRHSSASHGRPSNEISAGSLMELLTVLRAPRLLENAAESPYASRSLARLVRAKNTAVKTSAYIILAYVIFWAPYNALGIMTFIFPISATSIVKLFYELIALNAVVNPFIYRF